MYKDSTSNLYLTLLASMNGDTELTEHPDGTISCTLTGDLGAKYDVIMKDGNILKIIDTQGNEYLFNDSSILTGFSYGQDSEVMDFDNPNSVYYRPREKDVKVYNMSDEEVREYLNSIDNAINDNTYSDKEATEFFRCVMDIDGTELPITLASYGGDDAEYLLSNTDKYYDSFSSLPSKAIFMISEDKQPITICNDFKCIYKDMQICGFNRYLSKSGNGVFFQDDQKTWFDTFLYSFIHEMGHSFDSALGNYSRNSEYREELKEIFSKYNQFTENMSYKFPNGDVIDCYYYFKESDDGTVGVPPDLIDNNGEFRECEAFAEAFRFYTMNPDDMEILAPDMYEFMDTICNN